MEQDSLSFLLGDELVELQFRKDGLIHPDMSLLDFLRSRQLKSVKEGCGEGDCGACTVVIASVENGKLFYKAINACLVLLPMVQGCQLITTEHLAERHNDESILHPVQKALVDHHGSQCGYCTPGIVMSMFALWKNHPDASAEIIKDRLSGNLCRCTGYQPIIEAFQSLEGDIDKDKFSQKETNIIQQLQQINEKINTLDIQSAEKHYMRPADLETALMMRRNHPDAIMINGATDISVQLNKNKKKIFSYLDLSGILELKTVGVKDEALHIGAGISVENMGEICQEKHPAISDMISLFGSHQIRNLATPGGNIASASPIGDLPPVLMAADAEVELRSTDAVRSMLLRDFITGYHNTALKDDELITALIIPPAKGIIIKSYKISKRKDVDISTVSAGFSIRLEKDIVSSISLYYGGMDAVTRNASKAATFLKGKKWTKDNVHQAAGIVAAEFEPLTDARAGAEARRIMAGNLLIRFWLDTTENTDARQ